MDRFAPGYRYDAAFTARQMKKDVYTRWAHEGTLYGFTSYSSVTLVIGEDTRDEHDIREGFLIHRMFQGRYLITTLVALFYRASLLDFSERVALTTRTMFRSFSGVRADEEDLRLTLRLLADFQFFSSHWYFNEVTPKEEELEHYHLQTASMSLETLRREVEGETEKMSAVIDRVVAQRQTEAVNRLAMLSMILGGGAVITGFFGMNFGQEFEKLFFNPQGDATVHHLSIVAVSFIVAASLCFALFVVFSNWKDYRGILIPRRFLARRETSVRRGDGGVAFPVR